MRVNCRNALRAWDVRKSWNGARSIWSNGTSLYSYDTEILRERDGLTFLNVTKYSRTTTIHQNALKVAFPDAIRVDNVPLGGYLKV